MLWQTVYRIEVERGKIIIVISVKFLYKFMDWNIDKTI